MEVCVLGAEGPAAKDPNVVVSIRAGASRRQGAVQINRTLHFPVGIRDATPFKVDLLRRVALGQTQILPEDGEYDVPLECTGDYKEGGASLKLSVSNVPWLCGRSRSEAKAVSCVRVPPVGEVVEAAKDKAEGDSVGAAARARQYFDHHNVMHCVQALLEAIIRDRPEKPFEYISSFMERISKSRQATRARTEAETTNKTNVGEAAAARGAPHDASPNELVRQVKPRCAAAFDAEDIAREGRLDVDGFCAAIKALHPQLTSAQARAMGNGVAHGAKGITLVSFSAAEEAVSQGEGLAAEVAGLTKEQYIALGVAPGGPTESDQLRDVRIQVKTRLMTASEDGSLENALRAISIKHNAPQHEDTRDKVKRILEESCDNGHLERVLSDLYAKAHDDKIQDVRLCCRDVLSQAANDGSLSEALRQISGQLPGGPQAATSGSGGGGARAAPIPEQMEAARELARTILTQSAADGTLFKALASVLNTGAASDGVIADAPTKSKSLDKKQNLRAQACDLLIKSSLNGELDAALGEIRQSSSAFGKPNERADLVKSPGDEIEDLRKRAFVSLSSALESGRLEEALGGARKELSCKALMGLATRLEGGDLEASLKSALAVGKTCGAEEEHLAVTFDVHLDDHALDGFTEAKQRDLCSHVAVNLGCDRVDITNLRAGSVVCETHAVGFLHEEHRHEAANKVRRGEAVHENVWGVHRVPQEPNLTTKMHRASPWLESRRAKPCAATASVAPPLSGATLAPAAVFSAGTDQDSTQYPATSPRHAELLGRQRELLKEKRAMEERLAKLMEAKKAAPPLVPTAPTAPRPAAKRPLTTASVVQFKDLREVNRGLTSENSRLNAELSRLLALAAQRKPAQ